MIRVIIVMVDHLSLLKWTIRMQSRLTPAWHQAGVICWQCDNCDWVTVKELRLSYIIMVSSYNGESNGKHGK